MAPMKSNRRDRYNKIGFVLICFLLIFTGWQLLRSQSLAPVKIVSV